MSHHKQKMSSNLNSQLKDYLSKSSSSNSVPQNGKSGGISAWFSGKDTNQKEIDFEDASDGWFAQAQKDPLFPSLTKQQRAIGFVGCLLMGTFCFSLASLYLPLLVLKARKFALLYSMGSFFVIASFSLLWGPVNHARHLLSSERLPFTSVYFGTMFATIYFSLWMRSMPLTIIFAVLQVIALIWYVVSYIPGGQTGLKFFTRIFYSVASRTVQKTLPV